MASDERGRRSLHFQSVDPLSREATSRTTRYRVMRRRAEDACSANTDTVTDLLSVATPAVSVAAERFCVDGDVDDFDTEMLSDHSPDEHDCDKTPDDTITPQDTCRCSGIVSPCSVLVKQYSLRHSLTQAALADLLQLLRLYSSTEIIPSSIYLFEKQFQLLHYPLKFHYFCSVCLQLLPNNHARQCPNDACKSLFDSLGTISSFIEISIESQLVNMMQRESHS